MEATPLPSRLPAPPPQQPNPDQLKQNLLRKGVTPTPKILHALRKKHQQKLNRRLSKQATLTPHPLQPLTDTQKQALSEETRFQTIKSEYKHFTKELSKSSKDGEKMLGRPWERLEKLKLLELAENQEYKGENLNSEPLRELSEIIERDRDQFKWLLDDDIELQENWFGNGDETSMWTPPKSRSEGEAIKFLIDKLSGTDLNVKDWKFSRMMKQSGLQFTEKQMLRIVEGLGNKGKWRHAMSVVEWVYNSKEHRHYKSRFVYTKLLAILGKARKPLEALKVFNWMRGDIYIYPDMAAYHSLAVTLGQAGLLKELTNVIESMKEKPKKLKDMRRKNWDPVLQPDLVIFNAVLNACVPNRQWKGVSWVLEQIRKSGLRPNGATYGLAMEVMLESGKYDLVHKYFERMERSGEVLKALTYRVLVKAFWEEGKVHEAVQAVREMEQRGIVGTACVYYELACCLCYHGRWQEGLLEIEKLKTLPQTKPWEVTVTGMILSSLDGGHIDDCVSIFEHSKNYCSPDAGMINAMLKAYGRNDMFLKAKELYEETKGVAASSEACLSNGFRPDSFTFLSMLEASAAALQWEYFENVYKEMALSGYQPDPNRHGSLLLRASKAGKWCLLEHAFNAILEAGEIPPVSFFTEMIYQAVIQYDFERAVTIINSMAHAPFQVSKQQWIHIVEDNKDRISRDKLKEFLDTLYNHSLSTEATARNFVAALQSVLGSRDAKHFPSSTTAFDKGSVRKHSADVYSEDSDVDDKMKTNIPLNLAPIGSREDLQVDEASDREGTDWELVSGISDCSLGSSTILELFNEDLESNGTETCLEDGEYDEDERFDLEELELDMLDSDVKAGPECEIPTAHEILKTWKESRQQDGLFFPFQVKNM